MISACTKINESTVADYECSVFVDDKIKMQQLIMNDAMITDFNAYSYEVGYSSVIVVRHSVTPSVLPSGFLLPR